MGDVVRVAVPNKGRLSAPTLDLLRRAGLVFEASERALSVPVRNAALEILFVRADDIPELVHDGVAAFGITGRDLVVEAGFTDGVLLDLGYGRCRLVLAVPERSEISDVADLDGLRVATSHVRTVERFFADEGVEVTVVPLRGSVEVAPRLDVADAVVDLVSTGSTLMVNGLRPVVTLLDSEAVLIADGDDPDVPLATMLQSVVVGRRKRYVLMNAPADSIDAIEEIIPGADAPTVVPLAHDSMVAIHSVVDADELWSVLPRLEAAGASAILVLPVEQMIR